MPASIARAEHSELTHRLERLFFWKCELRAVRVRETNSNFPQEKQNGRIMPAYGKENSPVPVLGTPPHRALTTPQTLAPSAFAAFCDSFRVFSVFRGPTLPNPTPFQRFPSKPSAIPTNLPLLHFVTVCYTYFSSSSPQLLSRPAKMLTFAHFARIAHFAHFPIRKNPNKNPLPPISPTFFRSHPGVRPLAISLFSSGRKGITC
jgi:hypothetical protein